MSERLQVQPRASAWERGKPLLAGLVVGLLAGPFLVNALHWQVTASAMQHDVNEAVIHERSSFCEMRMRAEEGAEVAKLDYVERSRIAEQYATFAWGDAHHARVVNHCASETGTAPNAS